MSKRVLITGATGFIGSHVARHIANETDWEIIGLERYSVSGNPHRLIDTPEWPTIRSKVTLLTHDLRCPINDLLAQRIGSVDYILHLGASTHVDRSIEDPMGFVLDNVVATCNLMQFARSQASRLQRILYFSTDEVFGPAPVGCAYKEWDRYNSGNPYAAAKAGGEELALAFGNTYKLPVQITHTMNVVGPYQHPEKFLPNTIRKVKAGECVTIHASQDKKTSGSRFYIAADEVARAVLFVLQFGQTQDKFNIVGEEEISNLQLAQLVAEELGQKLRYEMVDFHSSRPGHDLRYALDGGKLAEMGFKFKRTTRDAIRETIHWYLEHPDWLGGK